MRLYSRSAPKSTIVSTSRCARERSNETNGLAPSFTTRKLSCRLRKKQRPTALRPPGRARQALNALMAGSVHVDPLGQLGRRELYRHEESVGAELTQEGEHVPLDTGAFSTPSASMKPSTNSPMTTCSSPIEVIPRSGTIQTDKREVDVVWCDRLNASSPITVHNCQGRELRDGYVGEPNSVLRHAPLCQSDALTGRCIESY